MCASLIAKFDHIWQNFAHEFWQWTWKIAMNPLERAKHDLAKTRTELSRAEMQVAQLQIRLKKIEAYIEMAALYESDEASEARTRNGIAALAVRASVEMLAERKSRMHTRDILKALLEKGITIGGANPAGNLSGFLSRSDELHNSRSEGWGLASWGEAPEPASKPVEAVEAVSDKPEPTADAVYKPRVVVTRPGSGAPSWEPPDGSDLDDEIPF